MSSRRRPWAVICLSTGLFGCGDSGPAEPQGPATVTIVSGESQIAKPGHELADPFVVTVTDAEGRGVPKIPVTWTVTSGPGALDGFDSAACADSTLTVWTDEEGRAQVSFTPAWFGVSAVTASVRAIEESPVFEADATDPAASLAIVSEVSHQARAGEPLEQAMWVRVLDGGGNPVPDVSVTWAVTSGGGRFIGGCFLGNTGVTQTRTLPAGTGEPMPGGFATTWFVPTIYGRSTVAAAVPGVLASPVTFTVDAAVLVIALDLEYGTDEPTFFAPDFSSEATVPIGAVVEWVNYMPQARITSTSSPPGDAGFDSGHLSEGERFQLIADVPGAWVFVDQVSGATGSLTAR